MPTRLTTLKTTKPLITQELYNKLSGYMSKQDVNKVSQAYEISFGAHDGQIRKSGDAYISHPVAVAIILADLKLDVASVCSALLHDCIEDTSLSKTEIKRVFGQEVAHIVDGVTKLNNLSSHSIVEKQAENFRKLFLAMTGDVRVILIKLSDRLHNMRTIDAMSRVSQMRIAKETLELHAPISHRLGLYNFKSELEDLAFKTLYPYRYKVISHHIDSQLDNQESFIAHTKAAIKKRLKEDGLKAEISGRKKESYSIFNKMRANHLKLKEVFDVYAFRLIVPSVEDCYRVLGSMHNLFKPLPGKFKDYIALPKINGYQSLHTILFASQGILAEMQIRSKEMDFVAKQGVAAHWRYKEHNPETQNMAVWISSLLDIQDNASNSIEFLESVKGALTPGEVFVFTPNGDIIQLPYKATVIDFAYHLHTEVGNHCVAAQIDKKPVPLSTELHSGQTVYIETTPDASPRHQWMEFAITVKAKTAIKTQLKNYSKDKIIQLGQHLLESTLENENFVFKDISQKDKQSCLDYLSCQTQEDLFLQIGLGEILIPIVVNLLIGQESNPKLGLTGIKNTQNMAINFANCCHPIPNEKITGVMSKGKGLVIHRRQCNNLKKIQTHQSQWLNLAWDKDSTQTYKTLLRCDVRNRRGLLADLTTSIAKLEVSVEDITIGEQDNALKSITFTLLVSNVSQLRRILTQIKTIDYVKKVIRV